MRHVALIGPTGAGKSALALGLARLRPEAEIVSVDSMAVYRGMDIGTAKPSLAAREEIPHHLIDVAYPEDEFTVQRYQAEARCVLDGIEQRGHRGLLVGGTGLYLRAIVDRLEIPGRWPEVAAELAAVARERGGLESLYRRLEDLDPLAAARMEPTNERRILRALEVTIGARRRFSSFGPGLQRYPPTSVVLAGIPLVPSLHYTLIEKRFDGMLRAGLVEEVATLSRRQGGMSRTARQALGYRELLEHLSGAISLDQATDLAVRRTKVLARRQWSWARRDPRVHWLDVDGDLLDQLVALWDTSASDAVGG
jgi:tRNA dimethylallyltransferase